MDTTWIETTSKKAALKVINKYTIKSIFVLENILVNNNYFKR